MSSELQKIESKSLVAVTVTWDGVRHWLNAAKMFEQGKLFSQVMTGFELMALRQQHGTNQGKRRDLETTSPQPGEKLDWPELCKKEAGISDETARRYMDMAKVAAPRLKKLPALKNFDPFTTPLATLNDAQREAMEKGVKKLTDGKSQMDFLGDLYKQGGGNTNAKTGGTKTKPTTAEQADAAFNIAMENSGWMGKAVAASNQDFFLTAKDNDLEIDAQIAVLEFALNLRTKYRNTPKAKREAVVQDIIAEVTANDPLRQSELAK